MTFISSKSSHFNFILDISIEIFALHGKAIFYLLFFKTSDKPLTVSYPVK